MKNKIMVIMCFGLITTSVLSFADDQHVTNPKESKGELAHDKVTFNHNQGIYNDNANKTIRAKDKVAEKSQINEDYNKKIQGEQDVNKGQFLVKF